MRWRCLPPSGSTWLREAPCWYSTLPPTNPSRAYMEWIGQWYLVYRQPGALEELAQRAGIDPAAVSIEPGPLGICPYIRARPRLPLRLAPRS